MSKSSFSLFKQVFTCILLLLIGSCSAKKNVPFCRNNWKLAQVDSFYKPWLGKPNSTITFGDENLCYAVLDQVHIKKCYNDIKNVTYCLNNLCKFFPDGRHTLWWVNEHKLQRTYRMNLQTSLSNFLPSILKSLEKYEFLTFPLMYSTGKKNKWIQVEQDFTAPFKNDNLEHTTDLCNENIKQETFDSLTDQPVCQFVEMTREGLTCKFQPCTKIGVKTRIICEYMDREPCNREKAVTSCVYDPLTKRCRTTNYIYKDGGPNSFECLDDIPESENCDCTCKHNDMQWGEWSTTCEKGERWKFSPFFSLDPFFEPDCTPESKEGCCHEVEHRTLEKCDSYMKDLPFSTVTHGCDTFGGKKEISYGYSYCKCIRGFTGELCQIEPTNCSNEVCGYDNICKEATFGVYCVCKRQETGRFCEKMNTDALSVPETNNNFAMIGGSAGTLLLLTIVVVIILKMKSKKKSPYNGKSANGDSVRSESSKGGKEKRNKKGKKDKKSPWEQYVKGNRKK